MRTKLLFNNVDASSSQTSEVIIPDCGQDMRWLLQITTSGTDGTPHIYVEESIDGTIWTPMDDTATWAHYFAIDESPYPIKDSYFMGYQLRIRLEPNDNTTGTLSALIGYKTKV
jgi:hypothetical protein